MTGQFDHLTAIRGQVAVVTGGTAGIGGIGAIALSLRRCRCDGKRARPDLI